eukprot:gene13273-14641_t
MAVICFSFLTSSSLLKLLSVERVWKKQSLPKAIEISGSNIVTQAGALIRDAVKATIGNAKSLPWPPTVESLRSNDRNPPDLLTLLFETLLAKKRNNPSSSMGRLIDSFCQDVLYAVSKGDFLTYKHASLGLGLHSLTGQKLPLVMLSRLGHSISYDKICEIEMAQAELVQQLLSMSLNLPLIPADKTQKVTTTFWWDNFDRNIETSTGTASLHNTPGIMFQEETNETCVRRDDINIPKSKRRSLKLKEANETPVSSIQPKRNPPSFADKDPVAVDEKDLTESQNMLILWKLMRYLSLQDQKSKDAPDKTTLETLMSDEAVQEYIKQYNEVIEKCLTGDLGKTPQYWMIYMKMIDRIQTLHYSVNTNSYDLRRLIWRQSLPFCFATNRVHYSRYGTYYVQSLDYLDSTHPGAKEEVAELRLSVRRNTLGIGQAVDMAGEQSYMKNAKTSGKITQFASKETTVAKWVMNRPFQARFVESLVEISGLTKTTSSSRKCLRPSQILKSNKVVENIKNCLKTQFLNPFNDEIEKEKLYNLVSGCPVSEEITESLLNLEKSRKDAMKSFEERLTSESPCELFFDPLRRNKYKSWNDAIKKAKIQKNGKLHELVFQRDILGILAASSCKENSGVDIDATLCYPLAPISMPLSSTDGTIRKTKLDVPEY